GPNVLDNCILSCEREFADCKYSSGINLGINAKEIGRNNADVIPKNTVNNTNIQVCTGRKNNIPVKTIVLATKMDIFIISNFLGLILSKSAPPIGTNIKRGIAAIVSKEPNTIVEFVKSIVSQDKERK